GKRYRLGPQILTLAGRYLAGLDIAQMGKPIVRRLMIETGESTELAARRGEKIQIVCKEDCSSTIQRVIELGDRAPIYATAAGKSILAHLSDEEIDEYLSSVELKAITKKTITDKKVLRCQLHEIRSGATAYSHEELNEGLVAMAAPVFNLNGNVVASIVVPIPILRFTKEKERAIALALRKSAETLSHQLGFTGDSRARAAG
ncbi:MAG: IclR family transcriptional regulator, partial [Pseudomonadota bacterium]